MPTPHDFSKFFTLPELARHFRVSVSTVWRLRRDNPEFPLPFRPTPQTLLFDKNEIDVYLKETREQNNVNN